MFCYTESHAKCFATTYISCFILFSFLVCRLLALTVAINVGEWRQPLINETCRHKLRLDTAVCQPRPLGRQLLCLGK